MVLSGLRLSSIKGGKLAGCLHRPCCFAAHTPLLSQSLLESDALLGVQVPAANQLTVNLCPLVLLDASVRMSRNGGDGEMGV